MTGAMTAPARGGAAVAAVLALAGLALAALVAAPGIPPAAAAQDATGAPAGPPGAARAVVLIHHPFDHVDPFGVPFGDGDTFSARHLAVSQEGRFDFPTFLADGVELVVSVPDPGRPYASLLENYTAAVERRLAGGSPGTLAVRAAAEDGRVVAHARFDPVEGALAAAGALGGPGDLRLMAAVVEDPIHYQPDARISNGVADHRFTVRALADLGPVGAGGPTNRTHAFAAGPGWDLRRLSVAAWVEAGAAFGRFRPGEAVQAASAPVGGPETVQAGKAVLVEAYSATWCTPCLYGDLALERLAIDYAGAAPVQADRGARYFEPPAQPVLAVAAAGLAAAAFLSWPARRRAA